MIIPPTEDLTTLEVQIVTLVEKSSDDSVRKL